MRIPALGASRARYARIAFVAVMLLALVVQTWLSAATNSATFDESEHITSGLAALRTHDFRMSVAHPPLMDMLCALPPDFAGAPPLRLDSEFWRTANQLGFSNDYVWGDAHAAQAPRLIFLARLPVILVSLGLALLVFAWARRLYGWPPAALALGLYCFEPNLLAHSSLATNDLGNAAASLLFVYAYWRYLESGKSAWLLLTGASLGAALLVKFSAMLLLPVLPLLALVHWIAARRSEGRLTARQLAWGVGTVLVIATLVVWAGYGFSVQPVSGLTGSSRLMAGQYLQGILSQVSHQILGQLAYLCGRVSMHGWWYYFPVALAVKTALPLLLLVAIAFGLRRFAWDEAFLLVPAAVIFLAAMAQNLNYGVRHILPVYPLLIIFAGRVLARPWPAWGRAVVGVLAGWVLVEALLYAPQYLPYFNELVGGPAGGGRCLIDSNLDWGQDLKRLAAWQRAHPGRPLYLSYFGTARPPVYGVRAQALPGFSPNWQPRPAPVPRTGWIAISVTCLKYDLHQMPGGPRSWSWLAAYRPVARAGYGIWIYHITRLPQPGGQWPSAGVFRPWAAQKRPLMRNNGYMAPPGAAHARASGGSGAQSEKGRPGVSVHPNRDESPAQASAHRDLLVDGRQRAFLRRAVLLPGLRGEDVRLRT
jgi:hypothetical protein